MQKFNELKQLVTDMESDAEKFYTKEQGAAGSRLRKALQSLKKMSQEIRLDVQTIKNQRKEEKKAE